MLRPLLAASLLALAACDAPPAPGGDASVTVIAVVPEGTGTVYITGSDAQFGPWIPDALTMEGTMREREATFTLPPGTELEYKFTLGEWAREAADAEGIPYPNFRLTAEDGLVVTHALGGFKRDTADLMADWQGSGVIGTLVHEQDVESAFLELPRHVTVWLPPGYDDPSNAEKRYRVIYMTDGQNLFDPRTSNYGTDWGVDEAMMRGVEAGLYEPAIVVATWSTAQRFQDYSPWHNGPRYAEFLKDELKPRIDATYRTLPGREDTFAMGSSMGGLMATYLVTQHAETFSACGCVSTHVPLSERVVAQFAGTPTDGLETRTYLDRDIAEGRMPIPDGVRMFFDWGTEGLDADYLPGHETLRAHLLAEGLVEGEDFLMREYPGADHNETSWRARVGDQLLWLLAAKVPSE